MILILLNESDASRRVVPLPSLVSASRGTTPAINESGRTFYFSIGGVDYGSGGSTSLVSTDMGLYACNFAASKLSVLGPGMVYYGGPNSSATCLAVSAPFQVVAWNPYDAVRLGLTALPNANAEAAGGLITRGTGTGQLHVSSGSVGILAQTHSGVTIKGIENYANISSVTLNAGTHSGATVQGLSNYANISNVTLAAGTHSNVTIQGVTRVNSGVTLNADTHSGASIQGLTNYANISSVTLNVGTHSGATIQGVTRVNSSVTPANAEYSAITVRLGLVDYSGATVGAGNIAPAIYSGVSVEVKATGIVAGSLGAGAITAAKFGAGAIDAAALAQDAGQEIADRMYARKIGGGSDDADRNLGQAVRPLRNRVEMGSVMTVYLEDDTSSAWTASVTTAPTSFGLITEVDPLGP
jgi:hypothetical protein